MKRYILIGLTALCAVSRLYAENSFTLHIDELFKAYVTPGQVNNIPLTLVDYKSIQQDERYQKALDELNGIDVNSFAGAEKKTFWINAYNILAIKMVLDHYPVESIKDISSLFRSVWDKKVFTIRDKGYSLNEIEHKILRPMGDPRIHAAIVCASLSCPDLRPEAYNASTLDEQLDDQVRVFLSNNVKGIVFKEGHMVISSIFKWFKEDFKSFGGIKEFIKKYINKKYRNQIADDISVEYLSYDWSLNDRARNEAK